LTKFLGFLGYEISGMSKKKQIGYKEERFIVQTGKKAYTIRYEMLF